MLVAIIVVLRGGLVIWGMKGVERWDHGGRSGESWDKRGPGERRRSGAVTGSIYADTFLACGSAVDCEGERRDMRYIGKRGREEVLTREGIWSHVWGRNMLLQEEEGGWERKYMHEDGIVVEEEWRRGERLKRNEREAERRREKKGEREELGKGGENSAYTERMGIQEYREGMWGWWGMTAKTNDRDGGRNGCISGWRWGRKERQNAHI
ncbi:hypothetical protein HD554DRAFT_2038325 [Boletus coccyginus]|nr:hypothetical protein HD554DRAFT_2038325 [Boletus coccyginus]